MDSREKFQKRCLELLPMSIAVESYLKDLTSLTGYCCRCGKITEIQHRSPGPGQWSDLRENLICKCGLNGRMRMIYEAIVPIMADLQSQGRDRFVLFERLTPIYGAIKEIFLSALGTEYLGSNLKSGQMVDHHGIMVQHEDMLNLSFETGSCDFLFHGDVLEHVPSHTRVLAEGARVLKEDGFLFFTCPFFDLEEHLVRAVLKDGMIENRMEPVYHGNPASAGGSLVFADYGWPLMDDIRRAGFRNVRIGLRYDAFQGIVSNANPHKSGHMWPLMFMAQK